ncbi:MAG: hypothetical protein K6U80_15640 [Firmicutes bacterium]|nr:hypothetical protein [Bacillota bacterium]
MENMDKIKFHKSHLWIRFDRNLAYVGLSHILIKRLGAIIYISLPSEGIMIESDQEVIGSIDAIKSTYDLLAPFPGKLINVNKDLLQELDKIKNDPYGNWIFTIEVSDEILPTIESNLLSAEEYETFWKSERERSGNIPQCS